MKTLVIFFLTAMACALPVRVYAETVTCTNSEPAVRFEAPNGMKADITAGRAHGACAMLELYNTHFDDSPVLIYPTYATDNVPMLPDGRVDLERFVNNDVSNFRTKSPGLLIRTVHDIQTAQGEVFIVRDFLNGARPDAFEETAYLPLGRGVLVFVLSATNAADLQRYAPAFRTLLSRVSFVRTGN